MLIAHIQCAWRLEVAIQLVTWIDILLLGTKSKPNGTPRQQVHTGTVLGKPGWWWPLWRLPHYFPLFKPVFCLEVLIILLMAPPNFHCWPSDSTLRLKIGIFSYCLHQSLSRICVPCQSDIPPSCFSATLTGSSTAFLLNNHSHN